MGSNSKSKFNVGLSVHAALVINAEKIVHVSKGGYDGAVTNLPGFRRDNGFSILVNYIPYLLHHQV